MCFVIAQVSDQNRVGYAVTDDNAICLNMAKEVQSRAYR